VAQQRAAELEMQIVDGITKTIEARSAADLAARSAALGDGRYKDQILPPLPLRLMWNPITEVTIFYDSLPLGPTACAVVAGSILTGLPIVPIDPLSI
jgi:hypothetical protein